MGFHVPSGIDSAYFPRPRFSPGTEESGGGFRGTGPGPFRTLIVNLEIDDPIEEGIYDKYLCADGATGKQIEIFEEKFGIRMKKGIFKTKTLCSRNFILMTTMISLKSY